MTSAHALEWLWNGKHSHCLLGPFWNGNFCCFVLKRFGREQSYSHHRDQQAFQNGGSSPDAVV